MRRKVAVIGQGYVGLPLAVAAAKSGYIVTGIDIDPDKVKKLNSGISAVEDIPNIEVLEQLQSGSYKATSSYEDLKSAEIILICVPTPLTTNREPNISFVIEAGKSVASNMQKGVLVILESTVEPGTTRNLLVPLLEKYSGLHRDDFEVAFSPERIDPGNPTWNLKNTTKIVAGLSAKASHNAIQFYSKFIDNTIACDSLEIAETAKLLENSFRFINISFVNEISIFCQKLGIDVQEVIRAAASKPHGFMPFYPSIGVGGHCIPVDPIYLLKKSREIGAPTQFIDLAGKINRDMPGYFVNRAEEKLGILKGKKILVVGVSYKPNVSDVRETPVESLIIGLKKKNALVSWHDDLVKEWNGEKSSSLSGDYDLAILATPHDYLDLTKLGNVAILNTRGSI